MTEPNTAHIIGLTGLARAGKDTVAAHLIQHANFQRVAFADALRSAALALDPWVIVADPAQVSPVAISEGHVLIQDSTPMRLTTVVHTMGWERAKDEVPEVRRILQRLGTEAGWKIHGEMLWVTPVLNTIATYPATNFVITDVRFPTEIAAIQALPNGHIFHVSRAAALKRVGDTPTDQAHPSERIALSLERGELDNLTAAGIDATSITTIDNNGSLDALDNAVTAALAGL